MTQWCKMKLSKIDRILYEIDYRDKMDIVKLPFDALNEKLANISEGEEQEVLPKLNKNKRQKVEQMIEGGLL